MNAPELTSVHPILAVRDLAEALSYYVDVLGFETLWTWGDPPERAGVGRDAVELQLACNAPFSPTAPSYLYCPMRGVDAYYADCVRRGALLVAEVGDRPFGVRDFRVTDPSGNHLGFAESLPPPAGTR